MTLIIDIKVSEYDENGASSNECTLRIKREGDYLSTVARLAEATQAPKAVERCG